jgi:hypothetical protein
MSNTSKIFALTLILLFLSSLVALPSAIVKAESKTIFVPDDYPTITAALINAAEGDIIFVKKGTYEGPLNQTLVITKTVSLIGEDANSTILNLHPPLVKMQFLYTFEYMGYLEAIKVEANSFKLANLTIAGDSDGISVTGDTAEITHNVIGGLSIFGNGTCLSGNIISKAISSTGDNTRITGNTMKSITLNGSNQTIIQNTISETGNVLLSCVGSNNNIAQNNISGAGGGIYATGSNNLIQANTVTAESTLYGGLEIDGGKNIIAKNNIGNFVKIMGSTNTVFGNTISNVVKVVGNNNILFSNYLQGLYLGDRVSDASNNTFYHNNFDFAESQTLPAGEKFFTVMAGVKGDNFLDNGREGNFWKDYTGIDWTLDGVGDMPYVIAANDTRNYHYTADFDIADVVLIDHHPLMAAYDISNVSTDAPFRIPWTFVIVSIAVIIAGLMIYLKKRK